MNGYNFTERVRHVLAESRKEAARLHHEYVGTEHMLLGLTAVDDAVGMLVLRRLEVDVAALRRGVEGIVKRGRANAPFSVDLPYTSRAKKVLELTMSEARELGHGYVGTEHLVIGLMREEKGIAAQVMSDAGLTHEKLRAEMQKVLGSGVATEAMSTSGRIGLGEAAGALEAHEQGLATGSFEVQLKPMTTHAEDSTLSRMSIDKQFSGDIIGTSKGEMLAARGTVENSAGYVAIERVTATLAGRKGTFVLQHSSTMTRGVPLQTIVVVPDSGTDELAGLTGKMMIRIEDKKHFYEFSYSLPPLPTS